MRKKEYSSWLRTNETKNHFDIHLFLVHLFFCSVVRVEGLEPPSREAPDPKSGVSTNFTTPARVFPLKPDVKWVAKVKVIDVQTPTPGKK
jgi:hypothetical protein